jgi:hypothetical protein
MLINVAARRDLKEIFESVIEGITHTGIGLGTRSQSAGYYDGSSAAPSLAPAVDAVPFISRARIKSSPHPISGCSVLLPTI